MADDAAPSPDPTMGLKDLFDLQEKIETRINAYWTYWSVAVLAIGGWLFTKDGNLQGEHALLVAGAVAVFFICNVCVLWTATRLVEGVRDEIRIVAADRPARSPVLQAIIRGGEFRYRRQATVVLHVLVDLAVIVAILAA